MQYPSPFLHPQNRSLEQSSALSSAFPTVGPFQTAKRGRFRFGWRALSGRLTGLAGSKVEALDLPEEPQASVLVEEVVASRSCSEESDSDLDGRVGELRPDAEAQADEVRLVFQSHPDLESGTAEARPEVESDPSRALDLLQVLRRPAEAVRVKCSARLVAEGSISLGGVG